MKRYTLTLLAAVFLVQPFLRAQLTPYFETTIWVEDAIGNRDSVVIGFDQRATNDIDIDFNEIEITDPFDSILEVRTGIFFDFPYSEKLTKRLILRGQYHFGDTCLRPFYSVIYIWARHQPVKISWDKKIFQNDPCLVASFFTNHYNELIVFPFDWDEYPNDKYYCFFLDDSVFIHLSTAYFIDANHYISIEKEVEGAGIQTLYGLRMYLTSTKGDSPCNRFVSIPGDNRHKGELSIYLFPNPSTSTLTVELRSPAEQAAELTIVNQLGQRLLQQHFPKGQQRVQLEVAHLPPGLYFLHLMREGQTLAVEKVVVVR